MPAVAMTDHGNILGTVGFYKEAKKNDIKPIVGSELYIAPNSRFDRPDRKKGEINYYHVVALVKNQQGYRNLSELISHSFTEGFYRKPRIDKEILEKYKEGLIILSACIQGEIPYHFLKGQDDIAYESAKWYLENFKEDFYLEIQNHGLPQQVEVIPKLRELSKELSIPLVASNDVHYLDKDDADSREILICLQTNEVLSNTDRAMKKETDDMYFKSTEEMRDLFADDLACCDMTMEIAAKCNFDYSLGTLFLPEFDTPGDYTIDGYFEKVCWDGFEKHKETMAAQKHSLDEYKKRLAYEIEKIREMGFPGYFLIVWDIIRFAREANIPVGPGRGSVVGSLVAYVMEMTTIDPLRYDLIFERFLNPERVSMPDIDIDFDGGRRKEVIEYIREKYKEENVAQIVTFGTMKAKMAIRDIGRVLEIPLAYVNKLAKLIPEGPKVNLEDEIKNNKELQKEIKHMPETKRLMEFALRLENNVRNTSMHAAAVVIAPKKLTEFMPLYKAKDDIVTQFEKDEVEEVGLLKMDILGLKTLTILDDILKEIKEVEGEDVDLENVPLEDLKTFEIFQRGDTDGIFQFESSGMREYLKRSKPDKFEDLIVLNALYRPGPLGSGMAETFVNRKLGKEEITYIFPELEEILWDTYGIIVFQEQVMRISVKIAGFTMGKADQMRKIMGKKQVQKLPAIEKEFIEGATKKGFNKKKVVELFSQMKTFAEYGFNKSHSAAYAYLAFQTAFLKAHYPVFFMSANLSCEAGKTSTASKVIQYISECNKMGISILPPDINRSIENFRVESRTAIRFGLKGLKNVGGAAITSIIDARDKKGGKFEDYPDFIASIDMTKVNKAVLESLVKAGVLDCFGIKRRVLYDSVEDIIKQAALIEKNKNKNQLSLFQGDDKVDKIIIPNHYLDSEEWSESEMIQGEKEIAGLYITHNPLEKFRYELDKVSNANISELKEFKGKLLKLGGVVTEFKQMKSKKGGMYGELFFEDLTGRTKVLAFKDRWENIKDTLMTDHPYLLEGRLPDNGDINPSVFLESLTELEDFLKRKARKVVVRIDYKQLNDSFNDQLKEKIQRNKDNIPYLLVVQRSDGYRTIITPQEGEGLKPTISMKKDIEDLTGENSVEILY